LPTYEYRCLSCEHQFERFQRMSDEPVQECEKCGDPVKRLLFPVAIQFKGSGFYTTDYAKKSTMSAGGNRSESSSSSSSESSSASESGNGNGNGSKAESAPSADAKSTAPATKIAS
jgi:putative FmdB family regulatory protein